METIYQVNEVKLTYRAKQKPSERPKVHSSESVYQVLLNCFDAATIEYRESFKVLLLNRANQVLGVFNISEGGICGTPVDIRLIMQAAILSHASCIILAHNHPSGNLSSSHEDDMVTKKVKEACSLMSVVLLDHLIITSEGYYSYADNEKII